MTDLTCKELVELVTDYLDDALPGDERRGFEHHIEVCRACDHHVDHLRATVRALGALRDEPLSPDTRDSLVRAFRDWKRGRVA